MSSFAVELLRSMTVNAIKSVTQNRIRVLQLTAASPGVDDKIAKLVAMK